MKVLRLVVRNVLGVKEIDRSFGEHTLWLIGGKNASGKTSVLHTLAMAFGGKKNAPWPAASLKKGEKKGHIIVYASADDVDADLHNQHIVIKREFYRKADGGIGDALRVEDDAGVAAPEPQTLLNRLLGFRGLDPTNFLTAEAKQQARVLRQMVGLDTKEAELDANRKAVFEERTGVNRLYDRAMGELSRLPEVSGEPINTAEIHAKIQAGGETNQQNAQKRQEAELARRQVESAERDEKAANREVAGLAAKIADLKRQLETAEQEFAKASERQKDYAAKKATAIQKHADAKTVADGLQDVNTGDLIRELQHAEEHNKHLASAERRKEVIEEAAGYKRQSDQLTAKLKQIEQDRANLMNSIEWPVPGLGIVDDIVTLNGLDLAQCSTAERIRVSLEIGMRLNPRLKVIVIQHGESLDDESLAEVERLAKERGYLVLVEYVCRSAQDESRCAVVMEDGTAREPKREEVN